MHESNYVLAEWSNTPEIARTMYVSFPNRAKCELREFVDPRTSMWVLDKVEEKHIACAMCIQVKPSRCMSSTFIKFLFTPRRFQSCGFASRMLDNATAWFGTLSLTVLESSHKAFSFYLKRGFKPWPQGQFQSYHGRVLYMVKK